MIRNKAIHIAPGGCADGANEVLGPWLEQNEGAKFRLRGMNELRPHVAPQVPIWMPRRQVMMRLDSRALAASVACRMIVQV